MKHDDIAIPADPNDPEDGDVTFEGLERGLIGRRLRLLRGRLGLDVAGFAARYGIPADIVSDYEWSRRPLSPEARSYLSVILEEPDVTAEALRRAAA